LGYANSNADHFRDFLDELSKRSDVDTFVILGDFVDMWRRDVSGLFLEFNDILERVLELKQKMKVYCVAGNHDFHLLKLASDQYPLQFQRDLTLQGDGVTYVLKHGWEFDPEQREPIMELLCYNLSDDSGRVRSDVWDTLKRAGGDILDSVSDLVDLHQGGDHYIQHLMTPPGVRLSTSYSEVENRALSSAGPGQILIFGHTHRPFLSASKRVANSGSWVSDESLTDTYVEIEGAEIRIMRYGVGEITQQVLRAE
jgi:UDP-2,3-diacylglucosamine pyrophosphatase LpxH